MEKGQTSSTLKSHKTYSNRRYGTPRNPWVKLYDFAFFFLGQEVLKDLTKTLGCSKDELPSHTAALVKKCHQHVAAQHIASWR